MTPLRPAAQWRPFLISDGTFGPVHPELPEGTISGMSRPRPSGDLEVLAPAECFELLRRGRVGRIGYTDGALPAITPVNYVMDGDVVVFRTAASSRLATCVEDSVVAFEVDELDLDARTGWSVVVVGVAMRTELPDAATDPAAARVSPWVTGDRNALVRIPPTLVTGRRIPTPSRQAATA